MATRHEVPLKTDFKPAVKVLSRKPTAQSIGGGSSIGGRGGGGGQIDPSSSLARLALDNSDDEGQGNAQTLSLEERRQKAQRDREEKQRRYDEARRRLFGTASTGMNSESGDITQPKPPGSAGGGSGGEGESGRRTKGRGGGGGSSNKGGGQETKQGDALAYKSRHRTTEQVEKRQLYDPTDIAKLDSIYAQRRVAPESFAQNVSLQSTVVRADDEGQQQQQQQPIRAPRGPDGSGRGFDFRRRDAS